MAIDPAAAKSKHPSVSPSELSQPNDQKGKHDAPAPTEDKRGTDEIPLTVKILPGQKSESQAAKEEYESHEKPQLERGLTTYTGWLAVFTAVLFVAAFIQVALFFWQLRLIRESLNDAKVTAEAARDGAKAAKDSANTAKLSMISGDRAYVHFSGCRWISHRRDSESPVFWRLRPLWINSGNTPTRRLQIYAHYELLDWPIQADYQFTPIRYEPRPAMIAPKGQIESGPRDIFGEDLLAVKEGRKHLYVWGIARYRDVFPNTVEHVTKFCVEATNVTGNPLEPWGEKTNILDIAFATFSRHNCADEDCDEAD